MSGNNYWIVTAFSFVEHSSYAIAERECKRLAEKCPDKTFKVVRCKRTVETDSDSASYIRDLEARLAGIPDHAAIMEEVVEVLGDLEEYFDNRADADQAPGDTPTPNTEMRHLTAVQAILAKLGGGR